MFVELEGVQLASALVNLTKGCNIISSKRNKVILL